jgi:hypothetical protein
MGRSDGHRAETAAFGLAIAGVAEHDPRRRLARAARNRDRCRLPRRQHCLEPRDRRLVGQALLGCHDHVRVLGKIAWSSPMRMWIKDPIAILAEGTGRQLLFLPLRYLPGLSPRVVQPAIKLTAALYRRTREH